MDTIRSTSKTLPPVTDDNRLQESKEPASTFFGREVNESEEKNREVGTIPAPNRSDKPLSSYSSVAKLENTADEQNSAGSSVDRDHPVPVSSENKKTEKSSEPENSSPKKNKNTTPLHPANPNMASAARTATEPDFEKLEPQTLQSMTAMVLHKNSQLGNICPKKLQKQAVLLANRAQILGSQALILCAGGDLDNVKTTNLVDKCKNGGVSHYILEVQTEEHSQQPDEFSFNEQLELIDSFQDKVKAKREERSRIFLYMSDSFKKALTPSTGEDKKANDQLHDLLASKILEEVAKEENDDAMPIMFFSEKDSTRKVRVPFRFQSIGMGDDDAPAIWDRVEYVKELITTARQNRH